MENNRNEIRAELEGARAVVLRGPPGDEDPGVERGPRDELRSRAGRGRAPLGRAEAPER
jgi:hypothetical protein